MAKGVCISGPHTFEIIGKKLLGKLPLPGYNTDPLKLFVTKASLFVLDNQPEGQLQIYNMLRSCKDFSATVGWGCHLYVLLWPRYSSMVLLRKDIIHSSGTLAFATVSKDTFSNHLI